MIISLFFYFKLYTVKKYIINFNLQENYYVGFKSTKLGKICKKCSLVSR